jgi:hypothetical protein
MAVQVEHTELSICDYIYFVNHPYLVITITGLSTNVSENNGSVQACVNITQGSVESSDNSVYAYISTSPSTGFNSAIGMTTAVKPPYNSRQ